jgi:hypothetical protein
VQPGSIAMEVIGTRQSIMCSDHGIAIGMIDPGAGDRIGGLRREIASIGAKLMQIARALADLD